MFYKPPKHPVNDRTDYSFLSSMWGRLHPPSQSVELLVRRRRVVTNLIKRVGVENTLVSKQVWSSGRVNMQRYPESRKSSVDLKLTLSSHSKANHVAHARRVCIIPGESTSLLARTPFTASFHHLSGTRLVQTPSRV